MAHVLPMHPVVTAGATSCEKLKRGEGCKRDKHVRRLFYFQDVCLLSDGCFCFMATWT
jgi:hypothetical protein